MRTVFQAANIFRRLFSVLYQLSVMANIVREEKMEAQISHGVYQGEAGM
jgi:hypothetical protein